ncbi:uncharacterized protein LOC128986882 isoform X2 [Macrosteles quadrilineatus]|uniref:uncharacterized protein LOC128982173 isoform X2 n=1 Tax=Macrosteles quadrilineatus TaxID=74068 RepID=UPI0023E0C709|nr:uncharacterized protein LOC128982173 isoform X2 [Macrosteles quadrilineatus]XP_054263451.1 uncharacterized protein LOC128986882 isoform X2 [Macrosteles quadrilineatus]
MTGFGMEMIEGSRESRAGSPNSLKKVDFDMTATTKQDFYEYRRKVKRGKYPKPFDADKKPSQSVLKDSTPSPIHPFFKRAWNINYWTPDVTTSELIENMEGIDPDM